MGGYEDELSGWTLLADVAIKGRGFGNPTAIPEGAFNPVLVLVRRARVQSFCYHQWAGPALGVALIKPTTSYFWFLVTFCHSRICGLAVTIKNYLLGCLPAVLKIIPKAGDVGELLPNDNNVIRPPPPFLLCHAMISCIFIHVWQIGQCSCMGATLMHANESPDFCLGLIFT